LRPREGGQRTFRNVELKFLPKDYAEDHAALKRFQREGRAASALNHSSICVICDIDELERRPFIAMGFSKARHR
jgi:hypothetical protein